jgi:hypothetical protein
MEGGAYVVGLGRVVEELPLVVVVVVDGWMDGWMDGWNRTEGDGPWGLNVRLRG